MNPLFTHVDMDAFYASVEELANPAIRGRPVIIAGPGKRSIITTASYAAREYGVRTGMTVNQAKALCRDIIVIKSDYRKYADASKRVMTVLESFTPEMFIASVDEAFLETTAILRKYASRAHLGQEIKARVKRETGLTCSIGMAGNRLLAKLASAMNKPDGLTILEPDIVQSTLDVTPVEKLWGIGPVTKMTLNSLGIRTCGQLGRYPETLLCNRFGSYGKRLSLMGRGEEGIHLDKNRTLGGVGRSVGHSVTLPFDITDRQKMKTVLLTLAEMVGRRARRQRSRGRVLALTWRYEDFSTFSRRSTLPSPICLTEDIYRFSLRLLENIDIRKPVRLLGISLSDLSRGEQTLSLFPEEDKREKVQKALDNINDRFGEFTLALGDTLKDFQTLEVISPSWRPKGGRNGE